MGTKEELERLKNELDKKGAELAELQSNLIKQRQSISTEHKKLLEEQSKIQADLLKRSLEVNALAKGRSKRYYRQHV